MKWNTVTRQYAQACRISYYAAAADIEARRKANGDDEASRWFERYIGGERIAWNTQAA
jgi:hypothetical protein